MVVGCWELQGFVKVKKTKKTKKKDNSDTIAVGAERERGEGEEMSSQ